MLRFLFRYFRASIRNLEVAVAFIPLSFCLLLIPFQKFIPLSRFQHYSFVVLGCALGFLLQLVLSWRKISWAGRLALMGTCIYVASFGLVFLMNPWIDFDPTMNTELQLEFRHQLGWIFMLATIPVTIAWSRWSREKSPPKNTQKLDRKANVEQGTDN